MTKTFVKKSSRGCSSSREASAKAFMSTPTGWNVDTSKQNIQHARKNRRCKAHIFHTREKKDQQKKQWISDYFSLWIRLCTRMNLIRNLQVGTPQSSFFVFLKYTCINLHINSQRGKINIAARNNQTLLAIGLVTG